MGAILAGNERRERLWAQRSSRRKNGEQPRQIDLVLNYY